MWWKAAILDRTANTFHTEGVPLKTSTVRAAEGSSFTRRWPPLTSQAILQMLEGRQRAPTPPPPKPVKSRLKPHPKKAIAKALKQFIDKRSDKVQAQMNKDRHLELSENARQLARRLADPEQVAAYICELNREADAQAENHRLKLEERMAFWYGSKGLAWLAWKKGMEPGEWAHYKAVMDTAALQAFSEL
jgi:hypothetical protein